MKPIFVGTAGWAIRSAFRDKFGDGDSVLARYATRLNAVEINSSFYRPHRRATYARWAGDVPDGFRFAVKMPKTITHELRLAGGDTELRRFADELGGLGKKLGVILVQLPPSLAFDLPVAADFFTMSRALFTAPIVCEPRHGSWFDEAADTTLKRLGIARVAADPALFPSTGQSGGADTLAYYRWHGSPKIYRSDYDEAALDRLAAAAAASADRRPTWCIFDNTAEGHATGNALSLSTKLRAPS